MGARTPVNRLEIGEETGKGRISGCRMLVDFVCRRKASRSGHCFSFLSEKGIKV